MITDASPASGARGPRQDRSTSWGRPADSIGVLTFAALGALAAGPAFIAYADFILNHFYRRGAVMADAGLLADLAWHKGVSLPAGPMYGDVSFYAYHVSPIFALLSALSWLTPMTAAQWFAVFTGTAQSLLAVAVFWVLTTEYALKSGWRMAAAVLLAVAFSFNGLAIAQVRYPHFEVLIASSMTLFLVAWWRRRYVLATIFFVLCLICREDAGFHVFAVLAVLTVLKWCDGFALSEQKPALIFLTLGFSWSVGALLLGRVFFPQHSSFAHVYLGDPPFAHLGAMTMEIRLLGLVMKRSYIFLPAVCAVVWAVATRNPYLLVGYIAFVPWTVLNLLANSDLAGTLSSYYGFPFLVAAFWPLIGWRIKAQRPPAPAWEPLVGFGAMVMASFTALSAQHDPSRIPLWTGFTRPPSLAEQASVERAMTAIHVDHGALRRLVASDGVVSLRPGEFHRSETIWDGAPGKHDALIYFAGDRDALTLDALASASALRHTYAVAGTPLRIATDLKPVDLPALGPLLRSSSP